MSEREEQNSRESGPSEKATNAESGQAYNFVKAIEVDTGRLRRIKINNVSGRTHVIGTDRPKITIRSNSQFGLNYNPTIEFKQDGAEIEIVAAPGGGRGFNFSWGVEPPFDPDMVYQPPEDFKYSEGEEWEYNDSFDPEERRKAYEERRKAHEERRRMRFEMREFTRQAKEQAKEAARQAKRGFWTNFDPESITNFAVGLGRSISDMVGSLGDIYLEVPNWVELEIKSVSGAVEISDIKGFCQVRNTSGVIKLQRLSGGLQLRGMSGRVEALEIGGRANLKVSSGRVSLLNCQLTGLEMSVDNGNIDLETVLADPDQGEYKINSTNGSVRVRLPRESRASIECRSLNGRISIAPDLGPVEFRNRPGQNQSRIEMNGGGRKMTINTINGKIELGAYGGPGWGSDFSDQQWPPPPAGGWASPAGRPPAPPAPPPPPSGGWPVTPPPPSGDWPVTPPLVGDWPAPPPAPYPAATGDFGTASRPAETGSIVTPPPSASTEPSPATGEAPEVATAAPVRDEPSAAAQPEGEKRNRQMEILQAIERGEISVDEGMSRLSELDE